ncbi:hypothetical protein HKK52_29735 [Pseudomonas sp. ADAK2]|uniref:hypothetical protein n=1 Tax=unclassified Pseudomonas TaxID=196821 RepID=UPI001463687F|nr:MULTISPECIES: hypothetical protein [unclassified Pseudomonas]QJI44967.1 hypothetical protein HKK53_29735 [Pseudomonas sp. ADAK7]QJI51268.1 hypothetical protein HKK52_29735 [Pseudomonas sp. ADAK2]
MIKRFLPPLLIITATLHLITSNGYAGEAEHGYSLEFIGLLLSCICITLAPGIAISAWLTKSNSNTILPLTILLTTGVLGWIQFWAWFINPATGYIFNLTILTACIFSLLARPITLLSNRLWRPLLVFVLVTTTYATIVVDHGAVNEGAQLTQKRYWLTPDNMIPKLFADHLLKDRSELLSDFQGDWQSSDRPPLETGIILSAYGLVKPEVRTFAYLCLGIISNCLWIFALWPLLRVLKIPQKNISLIVLTIACVGAVFVNSVFAWPKMLAGAMLLGAMSFVILKKYRKVNLSLTAAGIMAALSMLSHGAALFGLLGFSIYLLITRTTPKPFTSLICVVTAILIYSPWVAYQKLYDPPGDRLLKWQLAGIIIRQDTLPPLTAILDEYAKIGWQKTISNKVSNIRLFIGEPTIDVTANSDFNLLNNLNTGSLRWFTVSKMGLAPFILLLGIPFLFLKKFHKTDFGKFALINVGISSLVFTMLIFGTYPDSSAWLFTAPYSILLLWCAIFPAAISNYNGSWLNIFVVINAIVFTFFWSVDVPNGTALGPASNEIPNGEILKEFRIWSLVLIASLIAISLNWTRIPRQKNEIR